MGTVIWQGGATAVQQIDTLTVGGTIEAGDEFNVTIGTRTINVVAANTDADDVAGQIVTALTAAVAAYPEFYGLTIADTTATSTGTLTVTGTAGVPFTLTVSTTESGGGAADAQTFGKTATQAATGPNFWSNAANWDTGAVPVNSDDVIIGNSDVDILYGLGQSGVTLTTLRILKSYTGDIGLPELRTNTRGTYAEYRDTYLAIGCPLVEIGEGAGSGSGRLKINSGSADTDLIVHDTGSGAETNVPAVLWLCTHASCDLVVHSGSVGVAFYPGEAADLGTLTAGSRASVVAGAGVTSCTTLVNYGGTVEYECPTTTVRQEDGGELIVNGGAQTAIDISGGTMTYRSTATITTLNVSAKGIADFSKDQRARTVTNCNLYQGATLLDSGKSVTFTNDVDIIKCNPRLVTIDWGTDVTLGRS